MSKTATITQLIVAVAIAYVVFVSPGGSTYQVRLFGGFFIGAAGSWVLTKLYVRLRYGKTAPKAFRFMGYPLT